MPCDKCIDIHDAQKTGKTNDPCDCSCHSTGFEYNWTYDPYSLTYSTQITADTNDGNYTININNDE